MSVEEIHQEIVGGRIAVNIPGHADRVTTPLFVHTRKQLIEREGGRCFICNRTEEESGFPLESHHWIIERCLSEVADWTYAREAIFKLEAYIKYAADFARSNPTLPDIMTFVDDQTANGLLLCKEHHTVDGKDVPCGIHELPFPQWLFQRVCQDGFQFTASEKIEHADITVTVDTSGDAGVTVDVTATQSTLPKAVG
jgi:hypothetical protein